MEMSRDMTDTYSLGYDFIKAFASDWSIGQIQTGIRNALGATVRDQRNLGYAEGLLDGLTDLAAEIQKDIEA